MTAKHDAMRAELLWMLELNDRLHDEAIPDPHPAQPARWPEPAAGETVRPRLKRSKQVAPESG